MVRFTGLLLLVLAASPSSAQSGRRAPSEVASGLFQRLVQGDLPGAARLFDARAREHYGVLPTDPLTASVLGASLSERASWDAAGFAYHDLDLDGDAAVVTFVATRPDPYGLDEPIEADPTVRAEWTRAVGAFLARAYPEAWQASGASRSPQTNEQLLLVQNEIGYNPLDAPVFWGGLYGSVRTRLRALASAPRMAVQRDTIRVGLRREPGGPWGVAVLGVGGPFSAELEAYLESVGSGVSWPRLQREHDMAVNAAVMMAADLQAWVLKPRAFQGGDGSFNGASLTKLGYAHVDDAGVEHPVTDWWAGYSSCLTMRPSGRVWVVQAFTGRTATGCFAPSLAATLTVTGTGAEDIWVEEEPVSR